ncbi:unnamed protein product [Meganyctiphanes norvegica]|uniref:Ankyrin repeat domain-containing protein n=1 Tax=Meganyctiphanes norvegica TaxID=48144 RepID=A0AAV2QIR7_MEGNR
MVAITTMSSVLLMCTIIVANPGQATQIDPAKGEKLYEASGRGDLEEVKRLAGDQCTGVNWQDSRNWTSLHNAVISNEKQVAMFLLSCNADPNTLTRSYLGETWTPLMSASRYNHLEIAKALINGGSVVDQQRLDGQTALILAVRFDNLDMTNTLLDLGADTDIQDDEGKTAIHYAVERNLTEQAITLLLHGADESIQTTAGETAADIANRKGFSLLQ